MAGMTITLDPKDVLSAQALFELMQDKLSTKEHLANYLLSLIRTKKCGLEYANIITVLVFSDSKDQSKFNPEINCLPDTEIRFFFEKHIKKEMQYIERNTSSAAEGESYFGTNPWFIPEIGSGIGPTLPIERCCKASHAELSIHSTPPGSEDESGTAQGSSCCQKAIKRVTTFFSCCCLTNGRPDRNRTRSGYLNKS